MSPGEELSGFLEAYLTQQQGEPPETATAEEARPGEWRGLWTWMERGEGEILPASLELLGRARELADELGTRSCAVLFGATVAPTAARLAEYGADRVYLLDAPGFAPFDLDRARDALEALVRERRPEILLFPATIQGRNLAAQVSMALGTGIVPNCNALTLDPTERILVGHQTSFRERLLSEVVCPADRPQIFTVTPGSFRRPARDRARRPVVVPVQPPAPRPSRIRQVEAAPPAARALGQQDAIVAGGLGLGSRAGFDLVAELARELGGYAGATRAAVACGWADANRLITVARHQLRPRLYVACGVVGEYDHLKAIEEADLVVALTNVGAVPIAENADLVGIGEPEELVRRILTHLREAKKDRLALDSGDGP